MKRITEEQEKAIDKIKEIAKENNLDFLLWTTQQKYVPAEFHLADLIDDSKVSAICVGVKIHNSIPVHRGNFQVLNVMPKI